MKLIDTEPKEIGIKVIIPKLKQVVLAPNKRPLLSRLLRPYPDSLMDYDENGAELQLTITELFPSGLVGSLSDVIKGKTNSEYMRSFIVREGDNVAKNS